ncbi:MAG: serine/threonine protein kinase [Acidobacteria bacterium]|nr:serine/threonine protein kinase [Acidobacteriota bacterium]
MSDSTWHRVRVLFDEAAVITDTAARRSFVLSQTADDEAVRDEVLSLLDAADRAGDFLSGTRVGPAASFDDLPPLAPARDHIGPWRVLRALGEGGMGAVYLGERAAGDLTLRAAIKVVSSGLDRDDVLRRFRTERRILASLDHPGIARLLDGGSTDDGVPYFALEYVDGVPLTDYARAQHLDLRQRLTLFQSVCDAVEFAHRRLVVHRDLKPGNIFVGGDGAPKLLDFGIARLLVSTDSDQPPATVTGHGWMTPAYASPEQLCGEPVSTATDVYALGLILHELLTGQPVFAAGTDPMAVAKAKLDGTIARPSTALLRTTSGADTAASRTREARALKGDLDTIVLKALAPEPVRRYASAVDLSTEIERHLSGLPVRARPDAFAYRAGKFVRRHRWPVGFAAVAVIALVAGLALALRGEQQARRAEAEARTSAAAAERVSAFLVDLFSVSDPSASRGSAMTARELLDRGADRIDRDLTDSPDVQSRLRTVMAQAYSELGLYDRQADLVSRDLEDVTARLGPSSVEALASKARLASALMRRGEYARARDMAEEAVTGFDARGEPPSREQAIALSQAGIGHWRTGDMKTARERLERSLVVHDALPQQQPRDLIGILNNVAILRWQQDDLDGGRPLYQRALDLAVQTYGEQSTHVANTLNNLAILELQAGHLELARGHHQRALVIRRAILAADHPDIAESLHNIGEAERRLRRYAEARPATEEAWTIRRRRFGDDHVITVSSETNLGLILAHLGEHARARPLLVHSIGVYERTLGPTHVVLSYALAGLGNLERDTGRLDEAERHLRRAVAISEQSLGLAHRDTRGVRGDLARVLRALGRTEEASLLEDGSIGD